MLIKSLFVKKNFETLANEFLNPEIEKKLQMVVKDALNMTNFMSLLLEKITPNI